MPESAGYRFPRARILVFARAPVAGKVKTRLAADIGNQQAVQIYQQLVRDVLDTIASTKLAPLDLYVTPDAANPFIAELAERLPLQIHLQHGGDLGERILAAMLQALNDSDFVVLVGSDCPVMDGDYLSQAFSQLAGGVDMVLGPAEDGGYVLLGARDCHQHLFENVPWGTSRVLEITRQRIESLALDCVELETLWDVDLLADLRRWQGGGEILQRLTTD